MRTVTSAGVRGITDAKLEVTGNASGAAPSIVLGNDNSGFLASMKLDSAVVVAGTDTDLDKPMGQVPMLAAISSGSLLINATPIAIDVSSDSVFDVVGAINAAAAGVTAELRRGFRWNYSQLAALYAGSPQTGTKGALNRFVALLDDTIKSLSKPGSLIDEQV